MESKPSLPPFDFAIIPGCIVWLEATRAEGIVDRLKGRKSPESQRDHYVWTDPNDPDNGIILVFDRKLTDEESRRVQARIVERFNDDADLLPDR